MKQIPNSTLTEADKSFPTDSCATNKIKSSYLNTPGLEYLFRNFSDKFESIGFWEAEEISFLEDASEDDKIKIWNCLNKYIKAHHWEVKKELRIRLDPPMGVFLDKLNFEKNSCFSKLQSLYLNIALPTMNSDAIFEKMVFKCFRQLKNLQELSLTFFICRTLTPQCLEILVSEIRNNNLLKLKSLSLQFYDNEYINDEAVESVVSPVCRYLPKLESLSLWFANCPKVTNKGFEMTGYLIGQHLKQLRELRIHYGLSPTISDSGMLNFILNLSTILPNLRKMSILLNHCPLISDEGLCLFSSNVRNYLSGLRTLNLDFSDSQLSDAGFVSLSSSITKSLTDLRALGFNFSDSENITDKTLKSLNLHLLSNLQEVNINFSSCKSVTDEGVTAIVTNISELCHLKRIDLNFSSCPKISNESLKPFQSLFNNSHNFETISLGFSSCKRVDNKGFEILISSITNNMKILECLTLYFGYSGVTESAKNSAREAFESLNQVYIF